MSFDEEKVLGVLLKGGAGWERVEKGTFIVVSYGWEGGKTDSFEFMASEPGLKGTKVTGSVKSIVAVRYIED